MKSPPGEIENKSKQLARLESFSDGVFAIAITLLILELIEMLHSSGRAELGKLLLAHWKSFLVFLIGFLTILVCWINHHLVLSFAEKTDGNFFWVNGFVLLVVTFTPFPTAILAEYLEKESHLALAIFGFNYFMMSIAAYCITVYINNRLTSHEKNELLHCYVLLYRWSIIYTLIVFFVCLIAVPLAIALYVLLFVVFAFPKEFASKLMAMRNKRKRRSSRRMTAG